MDVTLLAHTMLLWDQMSRWMTDQGSTTDSDALSEFAGRACYQSFDRPNPKTRDNKDYMANILRQQHESILEHASASFYVTGVSRALSHELVRHRHLSFSQLSQRFVSPNKLGGGFNYVKPPAVREGDWESSDVQDTLDQLYSTYRDMYSKLRGYEGDVKHKQALEAARALLPNAVETRFVVTGNMRAWRDVIKRRWHVAADEEIKQFAGRVLGWLREIAPAAMLDIPSEPYED